jgi:hypothetical protein
MGKFQEYNLGSLDRGAVIIITLSNSANVCIMQSHDLAKYKRGASFSYIGGFVTRSPARFTVPSTGRWFVTVDLEGSRAYSVRSSVSVSPPPDARKYLPSPSRDDGYYSESRPEKDHYFVDKKGRRTSERPHVHVIHQRDEGRIIIQGTDRNGDHFGKQELPYSAPARDVEAVIKKLRKLL